MTPGVSSIWARWPPCTNIYLRVLFHGRHEPRSGTDGSLQPDENDAKWPWHRSQAKFSLAGRQSRCRLMAGGIDFVSECRPADWFSKIVLSSHVTGLAFLSRSRRLAAGFCPVLADALVELISALVSGYR